MRRENVGISNNKTGENPVPRKLKVSRATRIDPGLVGPKARPKGVVDGQQVNIPALPYVSMERRILAFFENLGMILWARRGVM